MVEAWEYAQNNVKHQQRHYSAPIYKTYPGRGPGDFLQGKRKERHKPNNHKEGEIDTGIPEPAIAEVKVNVLRGAVTEIEYQEKNKMNGKHEKHIALHLV